MQRSQAEWESVNIFQPLSETSKISVVCDGAIMDCNSTVTVYGLPSQSTKMFIVSGSGMKKSPPLKKVRFFIESKNY